MPGLETPGAPAGAAINLVAGVLDEGRQVTFENKSKSDAGADLFISGTIEAIFTGSGNLAKSTVKNSEAGKETFDKIVDGYSFGLSNLFQWVTNKVQTSNSEEKK